MDDDGESVKLAVGTLPTNVSAGSTSETTVAITDDDDPQVTVSFEQSTYSVAEGGTVEVTVTLDKDPERTVRDPADHDRAGRGLQRRLQRRARQRGLRQGRDIDDLRLQRHRRLRGR